MSNHKNSILLFGGTFDPIHIGHLIVARNVAEQLAVDKTILIPAAQPPHKNHVNVSPAKDRLVMTCLAVEDEPDFDVSDCEMNRPGPSYTLDTVMHFKNIHDRQTSLYWLIGADTIAELPTWYKIQTLVEQCTIVTAARPGYDRPDFNALKSALKPTQIDQIRNNLLASPRIDITATAIRRRVALDLPISFLTPPAVQNYITENHLYLD